MSAAKCVRSTGRLREAITLAQRGVTREVSAAVLQYGSDNLGAVVPQKRVGENVNLRGRAAPPLLQPQRSDLIGHFLRCSWVFHHASERISDLRRHEQRELIPSKLLRLAGSDAG